MPKYALYDPTIPGPSPVIQWYDADFIKYETLPHEDKLFVMTEEQWEAKKTGFWAIDNGAFVPYVRPVPLPEQARHALHDGVKVTYPGVFETTIFPVTLEAQSRMRNVVVLLTHRGTFPGGIEKFPLMTASSTPYHLTVEQYLAVAVKILDYAATLDLIADGNPLEATSLPEPSITV